MPAKKAARKVALETVPVVQETAANRAKMLKLIIKNFRAIGSVPVEIELDDIVVLVGANNAGKSSVLKAYELIMSGGKGSELTEEDFHNRDTTLFPEIELHTFVTVNQPGEEWIDGSQVVKERWIWRRPGLPSRYGYLHRENRWATDEDNEKGPWGATNVAQARRPQVHRVTAFDPPGQQAAEIIKILEEIVKSKLEAAKLEMAPAGNLNTYQRLLADIKGLQNTIAASVATEISEVEERFSQELNKIFPGYLVKFDAKPDTFDDRSLGFFKAGSQLLIGPQDGHQSAIDRQGGGTCRTLLWTALRLLRDMHNTSARSHVLLLDEPEICLHPNAVRAACELLYELPQVAPNWQVMVTTHSPCFINFENPHTKIARVFKDETGRVEGTTIYRPTATTFTPDEREALKLLNHCDPYLAEFFFGGRTILVEGDTEYSCFRYVISQFPDEFRNIHIVRGRGKYPIAALSKILNQFGKPYAILHDSDTPRTTRRNGTEMANPAWSGNQIIRTAATQAPEGVRVRVIASVPNFEEAYLAYESKGDKPYTALDHLRSHRPALENVRSLLRALTDEIHTPPPGAYEWADLTELEAAVALL